MTFKEKQRLAQAIALIAHDWLVTDKDHSDSLEMDILESIQLDGSTLETFMWDITDKASLRGLYKPNTPNYY